MSEVFSGASGDLASFPYIPRQGQIRIMRCVFEAVTNGKHAVIEAPTGTGKTVSVLSALLSASDRKILYLTRTNSQQKQVMSELRRIGGGRHVFALAVQGRNNSCLRAREDSDMLSGTPEELSTYCSYLKERSQSPGSGCDYYYRLNQQDISPVIRWMHETIPGAEEVIAHCADLSICPYELTKSLMHEANVVTAPYIYFFDPYIRRRLLEWMSTPIEEVTVVVDEAHNMPEYLRDIESIRLSQRAIRGVGSEAEEFGDPEILSGTSIKDLAEMLERILDSLLADYMLDEDGLIPEEELEMLLMEELGINSGRFNEIISILYNQGEIVRSAKLRMKRLPRSHIRYLAEFLNFWIGSEAEHYVKLVNGGENPSFELYCLDPSIAAAPLLDAHSSVHISGTFGNVRDYVRMLHLPEDTLTLQVPGDFPPENRKMVYVQDITTRHEVLSHDAGMIALIADRIVEICNASRRNTIVFLPSYLLLDSLVALGIEKRLEGSLFVESRTIDQQELMQMLDDFKRKRGSTFLSVMGGRISEGIDFPAESLEVTVIVGIPYPRPTAKQRALVNYYDILYGKGWDYAVRNPAVRKLMQAAGRMIRSEKDRGIVIILDRRMSYFTQIQAEPVKDAAAAVRAFFQNGT